MGNMVRMIRINQWIGVFSRYSPLFSILSESNPSFPIDIGFPLQPLTFSIFSHGISDAHFLNEIGGLPERELGRSSYQATVPGNEFFFFKLVDVNGGIGPE
jgi:hypothetical protein